jgi:uncharacterized membrane-anchored protein
MKRVSLLLCAAGCINLISALEVDSVNHTVTFDYKYGNISLGNDLAVMNLDSNFKYVEPKEADFLLEKVWGNPPGSNSLGMVLPENVSPFDSTSWGMVIEFSDDGYVKDKDADKINYTKLLKQMQKEVEERNKERLKEGYEPVKLVGWAEPPYYDKNTKKLYWAKELKFGDSKRTTLNYNIRILGRRGYLVLNVVSDMSQINEIKPYMQNIIKSTEFNQGHTYAEFNPKLDKAATYGIAGLIAGGILVKAGFFKLLIAGIIALKKFIIIGFIAVIAAFRGFFNKKKNKEEVLKVEEQVKKAEE